MARLLRSAPVDVSAPRVRPVLLPGLRRIAQHAASCTPGHREPFATQWPRHAGAPQTLVTHWSRHAGVSRRLCRNGCGGSGLFDKPDDLGLRQLVHRCVAMVTTRRRASTVVSQWGVGPKGLCHGLARHAGCSLGLRQLVHRCVAMVTTRRRVSTVVSQTGLGPELTRTRCT